MFEWDPLGFRVLGLGFGAKYMVDKPDYKMIQNRITNISDGHYYRVGGPLKGSSIWETGGRNASCFRDSHVVVGNASADWWSDRG